MLKFVKEPTKRASLMIALAVLLLSACGSPVRFAEPERESALCDVLEPSWEDVYIPEAAVDDFGDEALIAFEVFDAKLGAGCAIVTASTRNLVVTLPRNYLHGS